MDNEVPLKNFKSALSFLGLPDEIFHYYEKLGLFYLYDWQYECLFATGVIKHKNLVYCAPTSGGKTLIAELIMLKTALVDKKRAIFVLPFVSLVTEKDILLRNITRKFNRMQSKHNRVKVSAYYGDKTYRKSRSNERIIICTIEKANNLLNSIITSGQVQSVGCIIIDEMHLLGDSQRGFLLEILVR